MGWTDRGGKANGGNRGEGASGVGAGLDCVSTRDANASNFPSSRDFGLAMSCLSRLDVLAVSIRYSTLAEAMRVNRSFERMAISSRPASADAAGITSVPHAVLFNDCMPSTCSPLFALRSPPRWARSGAADTPARGVSERIAAAHARSGS